MSLYYERDVQGPSTHALVIGVGHYRYLTGGVDEKDQAIEHIGILKQLTSPPRSALAFAEWLKASSDQWQAPIATIDLLISPAAADPDVGAPGKIFSPATIQNIRDAYDAWKTRCDADPENIAVFFFSGHGVEKSEQYLLAEDFGQHPNNPWLGSFSFNGTRRAFHACKAKTQCFFVDACRKVTSSMLTRQLPDIPLDVVDITDSADCAYNLTLKASAKNEAAHGPPNEPSYFTQALLWALKGGVARKRGGKWIVRSGQVSARITEILGLVREDQRYPQRCTTESSDSADLLETSEPDVRLTLGCTPPDANEHARLICTRAPDGPPQTHAPDGQLWQLTVKAGIYEIRAEFDDGDFRGDSDLVPADPPADVHTLDCTP